MSTSAVIDADGARVEVQAVNVGEARLPRVVVGVRPYRPASPSACVTLTLSEARALVHEVLSAMGAAEDAFEGALDAPVADVSAGSDSSPAGVVRGSDDPASAVVADVGPAGEGPVPGVASCSSDAAPGMPSDWPARDDTGRTGFVSTGMGVKTVSLGGERRSTVMPVLTRWSGSPAVRVEMLDALVDDLRTVSPHAMGEHEARVIAAALLRRGWRREGGASR